MDYRTLLVHVDVTVEGRARLRNAVSMANAFGAKLIGVGSAALLRDDTGFALESLRRLSAEHLQQAEEFFLEASRGLKETAWRSKTWRPADALGQLACAADLIVGSRTGQTDAPELFASPDQLLLAAGIPVLLQPPDAKPLVAKRIIIGWKNTRETRRAVTDSLPLLKAAKEVLLLRFEAGVDDDGDELEAVIQRLRRHGVSVKGARSPREAPSVADDLILAAGKNGADLIVVGGYGHTRVRELILGGVTRGLLSRSPVYVLFSH